MKIISSLFLAEIDNIDDFVNTYKTKLESERQKIQLKLEENFESFEKTIDDVHAEYYSAFVSYLKYSYKPEDQQFKDRVKQYVSKLNEVKRQAIDGFNNSIANILNRIKQFHDQIVCR